MPTKKDSYYDITVGDDNFRWNEKQYQDAADRLFRNYPKAEVRHVTVAEPDDDFEDDDMFDVSLPTGEKFSWNSEQYRNAGAKLRESYPGAQISRITNVNLQRDRSFARQYEFARNHASDSTLTDGERAQYRAFLDTNATRYGDVIGRVGEAPKEETLPGIDTTPISQAATFRANLAGTEREEPVVGKTPNRQRMYDRNAETPRVASESTSTRAPFPGMVQPMTRKEAEGSEEGGVTTPQIAKRQFTGPQAMGPQDYTTDHSGPVDIGYDARQQEKEKSDLARRAGLLGKMFAATVRNWMRSKTGGIDDTTWREAYNEFERRLAGQEPTFQYNNLADEKLTPLQWKMMNKSERNAENRRKFINSFINDLRDEAIEQGLDPTKYVREQLTKNGGPGASSLVGNISDESDYLLGEFEDTKYGGLVTMAAAGVGSVLLAANGNVAGAQALSSATFGMFAAEAAGSGIYQAEQMGASQDQAFAAGVAAGAVMFGFSKLNIGKYVRDAAPQKVVNAVNSVLGKAPEGAVSKEISKLMKNATKGGLITQSTATQILEGKLVSDAAARGLTSNIGKDFAKNWAKGVAHSTGTFSAMSAVNALIPLIYADPDEYPVLASVLQSALKGAEDGLVIGGLVGGFSNAMAYRNRMNYWKSRGEVTLAEVLPGENQVYAVLNEKTGQWEMAPSGIQSDGQLRVGEIIGKPKDGLGGENMFAVRMDDGRTYLVDAEAVKIARTFDMSGNSNRKEFNDAYTESGYDKGQQAQSSGDPAATAEVKRETDYAERKAESERQKTGTVSETTQLDLERAEQTKQGRRDALREQMEQTLGQPFYEENGNGDRVVRTANITDGNGNVKKVYIVASDARNIAYIDGDGNKGTIGRDKVTDTDSVLLDEHLDSLLAEQDRMADGERMANELAGNLAKVQQQFGEEMQRSGNQMNVGSPEAPLMGTVVAVNPDIEGGVSVQVEGEQSPRNLTWEQVSQRMTGETLQPKSGEELVTERINNENKVDDYNAKIAAGAELTLPNEFSGGNDIYRFVRAETNEDGDIVIIAANAEGTEVELMPDVISNLTEVMGESVPSSDVGGRPVPTTTVTNEPSPVYTDPVANQLGIDPKYAVRTEGGNVVVNGGQLWADDPAKWTEWNDANPDRSMDSKQYLEVKLQEANQRASETEAALQVEALNSQDPNKMESLTNAKNEAIKRRDTISGLLDKYETAEEKATSGGISIDGQEYGPVIEVQQHKRGAVEIRTKTETKDGITKTTVVGIRNGSEVSMPTAHMPMPEGLQIKPEYQEGILIDEDGNPTGTQLLGVHEIKESESGIAAKIVVKDDAGVTTYDVALERVNPDVRNNTPSPRTPERTLTDLRNDPSFTSAEEVTNFIEGKIKRAEKALEKAQKSADKIKPANYDTPAEYRQAKDAELAKLQPVRDEYNHWLAVREASLVPATPIAPEPIETPVVAPETINEPQTDSDIPTNISSTNITSTPNADSVLSLLGATPREIAVGKAQAKIDRINSRMTPDMPAAEQEGLMREKAEALQEMLGGIGARDAVASTYGDIMDVLKSNGASENTRNSVKIALDHVKAKPGRRLRGFQQGGKVYLLADGLTTASDGAIAYGHENRHRVNKANPRIVKDSLATKVSRNEMVDAVWNLTKDEFYKNQPSNVLADEILANAEEIADKDGIDAIPDKLQEAGIKNEDFINFVQNTIRDGRRENDRSVAEAGRPSSGGDLGRVGGQEDVRNQSQRSGGLAEQRPGSPSGGGQGTGGEFPLSIQSLPKDIQTGLGEKGLTMDGGVVLAEHLAEQKRETGYLTPNEKDLNASPIVGDVSYSLTTLEPWAENYRKYPDSEERVVKTLENLAERIAADELVYGVVPQGTYKYGEKSSGSFAGPLRSNIEYVVTFDMDTSCPRSLQYLEYVKQIESQIGRPLTQIESIQLMELMRMYGQMFPCVYCYCENKRQALKQYYADFMNARHGVISAKTEEEALKHMYGHSTKAAAKNSKDPQVVLNPAAYNVFLEWRKEKRYNPTLEQFWSQYKNDRNVVLTILDDMLKNGEVGTMMKDDAIVEAVSRELRVSDKTAQKAIADIVAEWKWDAIENRQHEGYARVMDEDNLVVDPRTLSLWREMTAYGKSASQAKNVLRYVPYTDELKTLSQEQKDYINGMGGLRMHSSNDFRIDYVFDYFQFMADMAAEKMLGHTYTKSPEFVRIFGNSGYKINMSIAAYNNPDGTIRPNPDEGFDWETARLLREQFPNAGVMLMATSDEQIQYALDNDWVDMFIPFHASSLPKAVWYNMRKWTDYTTTQNERFLNGTEMREALESDGVAVPKNAKAPEIEEMYLDHFGIKVEKDKNGKRIKPHFLPGPTMVDGVQIPGHNNDLRTYLDLCRQYGVRPRFYGLKVKDNTPEGGGRVVDISEHPKFMKCIKETARTDTPQTPIQFNFDQPSEALDGRSPIEYAFEELETRARRESEMAGGPVRNIYESYKKDDYGIIPQFLDTVIKHKRETGQEYPLDFVPKDARVWFMTERKALEAAYKDVDTIPYHPHEYDENGNLIMEDEPRMSIVGREVNYPESVTQEQRDVIENNLVEYTNVNSERFKQARAISEEIVARIVRENEEKYGDTRREIDRINERLKEINTEKGRIFSEGAGRENLPLLKAEEQELKAQRSALQGTIQSVNPLSFEAKKQKDKAILEAGILDNEEWRGVAVVPSFDPEVRKELLRMGWNGEDNTMYATEYGFVSHWLAHHPNMTETEVSADMLQNLYEPDVAGFDPRYGDTLLFIRRGGGVWYTTAVKVNPFKNDGSLLFATTYKNKENPSDKLARTISLDHLKGAAASNQIHRSFDDLGANIGTNSDSASDSVENSLNNADDSTGFSITAKEDSDYMRAVTDGNIDKTREMVKNAAMAAFPDTKVTDERGFPAVVFHQTNGKVWINKETGEDWETLSWEKRDEWADRNDWDEYWEERDFNTFDNRYSRQSIEVPGFFFAPTEDPYHEYGDRTIAAYLDLKNPAIDPDYDNLGTSDTAGRELRDRLISEGYDGIINTEDGKPFEYVAFFPNQIKSADSVTYDDNGNVIPLSQRFNDRKEDIRFSIADDAQKAIDDIVADVVPHRKEAARLLSVAETIKKQIKRRESERNAIANFEPIFKQDLADAFAGKGKGYVDFGTISGALGFVASSRNDRKNRINYRAPIRMASDTLRDHASKSYKSNHPFTNKEIEGILPYIYNPVAVFYDPANDGNLILTDLYQVAGDGKKYPFAVGIRYEIDTRTGKGYNRVKTIYPMVPDPNNPGVLPFEDNIWIRFNAGNCLWADIKKVAGWETVHGINIRTSYRFSRGDIAKIANNFKNQQISEEYLQETLEREQKSLQEEMALGNFKARIKPAIADFVKEEAANEFGLEDLEVRDVDIKDDAILVTYDSTEDSSTLDEMFSNVKFNVNGKELPVILQKEEVEPTISVPDEATPGEAEEAQTRFSIVADEAQIRELDNDIAQEPAYRAAQFVPDPNGDWEFDLGDGKGMQKGFLYPPMSAQTKKGEWRDPIRREQWEKSDEDPERAILKKGKVGKNGKKTADRWVFRLHKGNGKYVDAAYNPYLHSSDTMLNDQFSEAQSRGNLVVLEVALTNGDLNSDNPYHAEKAKDSVGRHDWKAGPIQAQLTGTRTVNLTRYDKPMRIVPVSTVADEVAKMIKGQVDLMPSNVVWPQLRAELEKRGVQFIETDNKGVILDGEHKGEYYSKVYKKSKKSKKSGKQRFSITAEQDQEYLDAVNSGDMDKAQELVDRAAERAGYTIHAYHGTARADRVGNVFRPERATSGPMAFFTDDRTLAEGYASGKQDTSIAYDSDYDSYQTQFRTRDPKTGKDYSVYDIWNLIPFSERRKIEDKAKHIRGEWEEEGDVIYDPNTDDANGAWSYQVRDNRGNVLKALNTQWLESGNLYGREKDYLKVLELAGVNEALEKMGFEPSRYMDPEYREEAVYDVYLGIHNPFDVAMMVDEDFISKFEEFAEEHEAEYRNETASADSWDKNNITYEEFADNMRWDLENGNSFAWTQIPDVVTAYLKELGFDGIKDQSGKHGGEVHTVWIPFSSEQVKSADPVTYDDEGNPIPLSQRFNRQENDIRFSFKGDKSERETALDRVQNEGLSSLIGEDRVRGLVRDAYSAVPKDILSDVVGGALKSDLDVRRGFREFLRDLADAGLENDETGLLRAMINRIRTESGIEDLSDNDIRYMIWHEMSPVNGESDVIGFGRDLARRRRWTQGEDSPALSISGNPGEFSESTRQARDAFSSGVESAQQEKKEAAQSLRSQLSPVLKAMRAQKKYDNSVIDGIVKFAREIMKGADMRSASIGEVNRILANIKNATMRTSPAGATKYANQLLDVVLNHAAREENARFDKLVNVKDRVVKPSGVQGMGKIDVLGQRSIRAFRDNMNTDPKTLDERIGDATDAAESEMDTIRGNAEADLIGLVLARDYKRDLQDNIDELQDLEKEIENAENDYLEGKLTKKEKDQLVEKIKDGIRENLMDKVDLYRNFNTRLSSIISGGAERAKAFREADRQRIEDIHHDVNRDLRGEVARGQRDNTAMENFLNSDPVQFAFSTLRSWDLVLKILGRHSVNGEGATWNRMMRQWVDAAEKKQELVEWIDSEVDKKAKEIFGVKRYSDVYGVEKKLDAGHEKEFGSRTASFIEQVAGKDGSTSWEKVDHPMTSGELLTIYAVDKQVDGSMKLRKMGIDEDQVGAIPGSIDPKLKEMVDWIQQEFFPQIRDMVAPVHERMYGAPMAEVENYWPLDILRQARTETVDLGTGNGESQLSSTVVSGVIKRRKNVLALKLKGNDAFATALDHAYEMADFIAFAELRRDVNTLLSYSGFRNKVMSLNTIFGSGEKLWKNVINSAMVFTGDYNPQASIADKFVKNIAKGATASNINFRLGTAAKQILSAPAFLDTASAKELAKAWGDPFGSWNWCMDNLPVFRKRWASKRAGNYRLDTQDGEWKLWRSKLYERASQFGMSSNAFVDALTIATGAKATYETSLAKYLEQGYEREMAEKKSRQDATISFNETQQSAESAFMAPIQMDNTAEAAAFTVYRTSSIGYGRKLAESIMMTERLIKNAKLNDRKEDAINFLAQQKMRDGLDEDKARAAAEKEYNKAKGEAATRMAVFGWLLPFLWNLGLTPLYLLFGKYKNNKRKKMKILKDAALKALAGPIEGLPGGNLVSDTWGTVTSGGDTRYVELLPSLPINSEIEKFVTDVFGGDVPSAAFDFVSLLSQVVTGVNISTFSDTAVAIVDAFNGDFSAAREFTFALMRASQVPQTVIDEFWVDELEMTADRVKSSNPVKLAKRYAEYKLRKDKPISNHLYSKDKRKDKLKKNRDKIEGKLDDRQEINKPKKK